MRVTANFNQPKTTNKQAFGKAHIIMREERLLWETATQYGYKEKYVVPLKKMWKEMKKVPALKEAIRKAPKEVKIDFSVTNFNPGAFDVTITKGKNPEYKFHGTLAPTGMPDGYSDYFVKHLTSSIKSASKRRG